MLVIDIVVNCMYVQLKTFSHFLNQAVVYKYFSSSGDLRLLTITSVHGSCDLPAPCTGEAAALQEGGTTTRAGGIGIRPDGGPSTCGQGT